MGRNVLRDAPKEKAVDKAPKKRVGTIPKPYVAKNSKLKRGQ